MTRYILEGTWSGYHSRQMRVVHRQVVEDPEPYQRLTSIGYTDGTALYLSIRQAEAHEKVVEVHGYTELIAEAVASGESHYTVRPRRQA